MRTRRDGWMSISLRVRTACVADELGRDRNPSSISAADTSSENLVDSQQTQSTWGSIEYTEFCLETSKVFLRGPKIGDVKNRVSGAKEDGGVG